MAEISGFHNSVNGDRRYKADFWARFLGSFIGNGVYPNPSTNLQVIANGDMTVTVKAGKAWVNGVFYENTADMVLNLDVADGVLKRIDRVVLQFSTIDRTIAAKVKKGTFASSPVAPNLQRDADAYELGIADILVNNGAVSISQANITDLRLNITYCGIVHGVVDQVDTTTIFNQYQAWFGEFSSDAEAEFYTFLAQLENSLSGDVAGNLLVKINENAAGILKKLDRDDYVKSPGYATATGSANTYAVTLDPAPTAYVDGMGVVVKINVQNTGASTINVNGLGAISVLDSKGNAMTSGKLKAGTPYTLRYNGTNFILQGEGASGDAIASDLYSGKTASVDAGDIVGTNPYKSGVVVKSENVTISAYAGKSTFDTAKCLVASMIDSSGFGWVVQFVSSTNIVFRKMQDQVGNIASFSITLSQAVNGYSQKVNAIIDDSNNVYICLSNCIVKVNLVSQSLIWQTPLLTNWSIQSFASDKTFSNFYIGNEHGSGTELFRQYNSSGGLVNTYSDSVNACKNSSLVVDYAGNIHMLTYARATYPYVIDYKAFTPALGILCQKTRAELGVEYKGLFVSSKDTANVYFRLDYSLQKFNYTTLTFSGSISISKFVYLLNCGKDGNFLCCGGGGYIGAYAFVIQVFDTSGNLLCMTNPNESYSYPGVTFRGVASQKNKVISHSDDTNSSYPSIYTANMTRILPEYTLV